MAKTDIPETVTPTKTIYKITAPEQKWFDQTTGLWHLVDPYTSKKPIFGVLIVNGKGETDSFKTAVEFADMGYIVDPNPKTPVAEPA